MGRLIRELAAWAEALRFFTRLPLPGWVGYSPEALQRAPRYLPAVGLLVGGLGAAVYGAAGLVLPTPVAILLSMAATLYVTGAFHEDGLADTADGLGGGWDKARILAIMKDSRIGSYGVIALGLALLAKFVLLSALPAALLPWALLAGHVVSRALALLPMATLDYARDDDTAKSRPLAARLSPWGLLGAGLLALAVVQPLPAGEAAAGVVLAMLGTLWLMRQFRRWLGGYTGDCLGAVQQLAELAFYLGLLLRWPQGSA